MCATSACALSVCTPQCGHSAMSDLVPQPHPQRAEMVLTDAEATQAGAVTPKVVMPGVLLHQILVTSHAKSDEDIGVIVKLLPQQIPHDSNPAVVPLHLLVL